MLTDLGAIDVVMTSQRQIELDSAGMGDPDERIETGRVVPPFPSGDHRLWLAHAPGKLPLGEAGFGAHASHELSTVVGPQRQDHG